MIVFTFINIVLGDAIIAMFTDNALSSTADNFVIMPFIITNLVGIMLGVGFITAILLYAKLRGFGQ